MPEIENQVKGDIWDMLEKKKTLYNYLFSSYYSLQTH